MLLAIAITFAATGETGSTGDTGRPAAADTAPPATETSADTAAGGGSGLVSAASLSGETGGCGCDGAGAGWWLFGAVAALGRRR